MITAGSFKSEKGEDTTSALIFPDSLLLHDIDPNDPNDQSIKTFIQNHLLPKDPTSSSHHQPTPLDYPTILICGHGGRDQRCGILGPLLKDEFERQLPRFLPASTPNSESQSTTSDTLESDIFTPSTPQVGLISHIGGHKFAGNIIIYIPPSYTLPQAESRQLHPLAGKGIWYGRVSPQHVEGIIRETIIVGKVIKELFRGGVGIGGEILRLPLELKARKRWF